MNIKRTVSALAAGALAGTLALATPAHAAWSDCTNYAGTFCLFANANGGNPIWRQTPAQVGTCRNLAAEGWNDTVTSMRNMSSTYVIRLWQNSDCTGGPVEVLYGYNYDLTGNAWNDQFSAISKRFA